MPIEQRHCWLQFRLRTLLVVLTLLAVGLGVFVHPLRKQSRAAARVRQAGGVVVTRPMGPWWWQIFGSHAFVEVVSVDSSSGLSDLAVVKDLPSMRALTLRGNGCSDANLRELRHVRLESLRLLSGPVTDAGLEELAAQADLRSLVIQCPAVSDEGLRHIGTLTNLESLTLFCPKVTDAGMEHLRALTNLRSLDLRSTKVTPAGVARLQRALPRARIFYGQRGFLESEPAGGLEQAQP